VVVELDSARLSHCLQLQGMKLRKVCAPYLSNGSIFVCSRFHEIALKGRYLGLEVRNSRANARKLLLSSRKLGVGLNQHGTLGSNHLVDAEVLADVDYPTTQTSSRS
jgi:hypothetical protein